MVSILLIVMMHVCSLVGYTDASVMNKIWLGAINAIGNCGVSCFILISGYYGVRFNKRKFLYLAILTTIYALIVALLNDGFCVKTCLKAALCIPLYNNWFVICYLIVMLLSPYINKMVNILSKQDFKKMLFLLIIVLSVIPTLFYYPSVNGVILSQGGKCLSYFLFIYLMGRYIRLHHDFNLHEKRNGIALAGGGVVFAFLFTLVLVLAASHFSHQRFFIYSFDNSITILIQSILLFYIAKSYRFHSPIINRIAASVFAVYVLNDAYKYVDRMLFHVETMSSEWYYILAVLAESLFMFVAAFLIDQVVGRLVKRCVGLDVV